MKVYIINMYDGKIETINVTKQHIRLYRYCTYYKTFTKAKKDLMRRLRVQVDVKTNDINNIILKMSKLSKLKKKDVKV